MKKSLNGFSIAEIVVVIAVISILATISLMSFGHYQSSARDTQRSSKATILAEALEKYYDNNGEYPGCLTVSDINATAVTTAILPGVEATTLLTPQSAATDTNSIKCQDLSVGGPDVFAYLGDSSVGCTGNQACLKFTLKYKEESTGQIKTIASRRQTAAAPTITALADNFDRTGSSLGTTSTGNVAWNVLAGAWTTNATQATTSSAASTNPLAVVNSTRSNVDASVNLNPNDALYFRVQDANNWWRVREQSNAQCSTYTTQDPYTYYTSEPYTYTTEDPYYSYEYEWAQAYYCPAPATGYDYGWFPPTTAWGTSAPYFVSSIYLDHYAYAYPNYPKIPCGVNYASWCTTNSTSSYYEGDQHYHYHYKSGGPYQTGNSQSVYAGSITTTHTGYTDVAHTGYNTVSHTDCTDYFGLVLEKSVNGVVSQVWAQTDTTVRPTLARVVATGNNIAVYSLASGSPLTTVTDPFGSSFTKHGIGRAGSNTGSSGIDNFSVVNQ